MATPASLIGKSAHELAHDTLIQLMNVAARDMIENAVEAVAAMKYKRSAHLGRLRTASSRARAKDDGTRLAALVKERLALGAAPRQSLRDQHAASAPGPARNVPALPAPVPDAAPDADAADDVPGAPGYAGEAASSSYELEDYDEGAENAEEAQGGVAPMEK